MEKILKGNGKKGKVPDLRDGKAAGRIFEIIEVLAQRRKEQKKKMLGLKN